MTEATREIGFEQARALEERYLMRTYKRAPVDFVRGEGPLLWDAEGKRVPRLPHRDLGLLGRPLPPEVVEGGPRADPPADPRLQPLLHRADGAAGRAPRGVEPRRPRLLLQLGHRGQRVRDQDRPQARPRPRRRRAGDRQLRERLPRPHLRRPLGDPRAGGERGAGADAARLPRRAPQRRRRSARGGGGAHRRGPDRADPGRVRRLPDLRRGAARRPRRPATRPARC